MSQTLDVDQRQWLESLIKKYSKPLIRYATGILKDAEVAKEVVQECFLKCLQQNQTQIQIPGWLYREVRNRAIDIWRKHRKTESLSEESQNNLRSDLPNPLEGLEARQDMQHLVQQIEKLSPRDQEVVRLKYAEGLTYQQIADVLDLTATNVGFILFQALKKIREGSVVLGAAEGMAKNGE